MLSRLAGATDHLSGQVGPEVGSEKEADGALKYRENGMDHYGNDLPEDICAYIPEGAEQIAGYRVRWREEDENGIKTRPSKSFSARKLDSLDDALVAAGKFLEEAQLGGPYGRDRHPPRTRRDLDRERPADRVDRESRPRSQRGL